MVASVDRYISSIFGCLRFNFTETHGYPLLMMGGIVDALKLWIKRSGFEPGQCPHVVLLCKISDSRSASPDPIVGATWHNPGEERVNNDALAPSRGCNSTPSSFMLHTSSNRQWWWMSRPFNLTLVICEAVTALVLVIIINLVLLFSLNLLSVC